MKRQKWKEINWAILFGVTLLCTSTQLLCLSPHKRTRNTKLTYVFVIFFLSTFYHISLLRASMHFSVCSCSCYFCIECANYTWQDEKKNKKKKKKSWHDEFGFCTTRRDNSVGRTKSGIQFIAILALEQMLDIHCRKHSRWNERNILWRERERGRIDKMGFLLYSFF